MAGTGGSSKGSAGKTLSVSVRSQLAVCSLGPSRRATLRTGECVSAQRSERPKGKLKDRLATVIVIPAINKLKKKASSLDSWTKMNRSMKELSFYPRAPV